MADRAFQHVGDRVYVDGVPFGGWIEPGDCYVSNVPLLLDDIDLVATVETLTAENERLWDRLHEADDAEDKVRATGNDFAGTGSRTTYSGMEVAMVFESLLDVDTDQTENSG